jgi:hypothetical protein
MRVYFVDTNVFLQCKPLKQLPWAEISEDSEIVLLISRVVQEEIDKNKQDGNGRRASRARKTSSLFRNIILSEDPKLILRDSAPHVELSFAPVGPALGPAPTELDPARADDRLVLECLAYKQNNPDRDVYVLTHDTGPLLTAKRCGLAFTSVPDTWLLDPEPDPRDKKIDELERKLAALARSRPEISIQITKGTEVVEPPLVMRTVQYRALIEEEIEALAAEVFKLWPVETDFSQAKKPLHGVSGIAAGELLASMYVYRPPTEAAIRKYTKEDYPQWQKRVRKLFKRLANFLNAPANLLSLVIKVMNTGYAPAQNTIVTFRTRGGLVFFPPVEEDEKKFLRGPHIPFPPDPPEGQWILKPTTVMSLPLSASLSAEVLRQPSPILEAALLNDIVPFSRSSDRHAFRRKGEEPSTIVDVWTFECPEFRHREAGKNFSLDLYLPPEVTSTKCALECTVTASNLPEPQKTVWPICIERSEGNTMEKAWALVNPGFVPSQELPPPAPTSPSDDEGPRDHL